jgi:hypothetical protein
MACTLAIYTHRSTVDRTAAEEGAGVIFGDGWVPPKGRDL